jgi:hypothetical protein
MRGVGSFNRRELPTNEYTFKTKSQVCNILETRPDFFRPTGLEKGVSGNLSFRVCGPRKLMKVLSVTVLFSAWGPRLSTLGGARSDSHPKRTTSWGKS